MSRDPDLVSASTLRDALHPSTENGQHQSSCQPASGGALPSLHDCDLHRCIYIVLRCPRCGEVRQAVAEIPINETTACPECGQNCSFVQLGFGLTKRNLPFHQVHIHEPTRWDQRPDIETNSS